jgi:hypothetical protein
MKWPLFERDVQSFKRELRQNTLRDPCRWPFLSWKPGFFHLFAKEKPSQGGRHSSPLPLKTEIVGTRFERKSWLLVPVLRGTFGSSQRLWQKGQT